MFKVVKVEQCCVEGVRVWRHTSVKTSNVTTDLYKMVNIQVKLSHQTYTLLDYKMSYDRQ